MLTKDIFLQTPPPQPRTAGSSGAPVKRRVPGPSNSYRVIIYNKYNEKKLGMFLSEDSFEKYAPVFENGEIVRNETGTPYVYNIEEMAKWEFEMFYDNSDVA